MLSYIWLVTRHSFARSSKQVEKRTENKEPYRFLLFCFCLVNFALNNLYPFHRKYWYIVKKSGSYYSTQNTNMHQLLQLCNFWKENGCLKQLLVFTNEYLKEVCKVISFFVLVLVFFFFLFSFTTVNYPSVIQFIFPLSAVIASNFCHLFIKGSKDRTLSINLHLK